MRNGLSLALPGAGQIRRLTQAVAVLVSLAIALYGGSQWDVWLSWRNAQPFGQVDPVLGYEVAFYVFSLPFYRFVLGLAEFLTVLTLLAVGGLYFLSGHISSSVGRGVSLSLAARRHLFLLVALFLVFLAAGSWLERAEYLIQPSTHIYGASYTDVHARMPVAALLTVIPAD